MKSVTYHLELVTPCFCAGAEQVLAEFRPPSIRGQLRWWFRAMGGNSEDEAHVFGATSGESGRASTIQIRTAIIERGAKWEPPRIDPNSPSAYVYYFASVSGKHPGQRGSGPRWTADGNLPPGTRIALHLRWLRSVSEEVRNRMEQAIRLWLSLGAVGTRATRGLGAFQCDEHPLVSASLEELGTEMLSAGFEFRVWKRDLPNWNSAVHEAGRVLKESLRNRFPAGKSGNKPSPLGTSQPRQASAVYLRPVKFYDHSYGLVLFEAPATKVLGQRSRHGAPALAAI